MPGTGSAINLSVSLMMRFGKAAILMGPMCLEGGYVVVLLELDDNRKRDRCSCCDVVAGS